MSTGTRISIFGLGYVGCVSAACLARDGHSVVGVDISRDKVEQLNQGRSPIIEPGLSELVARSVEAGRLRATCDTRQAVLDSDFSLVCVGTPSGEAGDIDLIQVKRACSEIGAAIKSKSTRHYVLLRSTVLPGTTEEVAIPELAHASGKPYGDEFRVAFYPEFLREGSAISDNDNPSQVVVGSDWETANEAITALHNGRKLPVVYTSIRMAEMLKYASNAYHAMKVAFANEIGSLCKSQGIDGQGLMQMFVKDNKLNLSSAYLRPGNAFGGSCLPKDLRALLYRARKLSLECPLLTTVLESNERHKRRVLELIRRAGRKQVAVLGLSFKPATDDLRESPAVELVETLVGKGYQVAVFDPSVRAAALIGSNLSYIQRELPHLHRLLRTSLEEVLAFAETIVITNWNPEFGGLNQYVKPDHVVIDLVGAVKDPGLLSCRYEGICW